MEPARDRRSPATRISIQLSERAELILLPAVVAVLLVVVIAIVG